MIHYFQGDQRRVHHALKVHDLAVQLGRLERLSEGELAVLETAALLHDIGIPEAERKHNSSAGSWQELEGPPVAEKLLEDFPLSEDEKGRVLFLIGHHHSYNAVDGRDFQILIEADFLVNMYEDGFSAAQVDSVGRKIFRTPSGLDFLMSLSGQLKD
ncbi:MAG: HD domain-containing protein [Spirochaetales bacterium]|nr:HD domain-containing protein [Spirochaetales bacterium]